MANPTADTVKASASTESSAAKPPVSTIPFRGVVTTLKGQYLQTTINDSDPAWNLDPAIVEPSATALDPNELLGVYRLILTFMAEQGIDSPLNGGAQAPADWVIEHGSAFSKDAHGDELRNAITAEGRAIVMTEPWQADSKYDGAYNYVYDPDRPRVLSRTIAPASVWKPEGWDMTVAVKANVSYTMAVQPKPDTTEELVQTSSGTMTYSASKDPADGKWRIDGYQHEVHTTEAW